MNSSAVLRVAARDLTGAAEAQTHEGPALAIAAPSGASRTAPPTTSMKEVATYGDQGTRPRHEDHDDRPARREDHHDHPQGRRWFPVTAQILDFPRSISPEQQELNDAVDAFFATAVTSTVPVAVVRAMQSEDASTVHTTIHGVPAVVPVQSGRMSPAEIAAAWQEIRETAPLYQLEVAS